MRDNGEVKEKRVYNRNAGIERHERLARDFQAKAELHAAKARELRENKKKRDAGRVPDATGVIKQLCEKYHKLPGGVVRARAESYGLDVTSYDDYDALVFAVVEIDLHNALAAPSV